jgi:protein-disulfide isomerase
LVSALKDPEVLRFLLEDIRKGMRLEIRGTPSYEIDGTVYEGQIPGSALSLAIGKSSK